MRSGFVSIVGRTNAGKSSLLNSLLNEKIAIVSHKQNATRRKINGIVMHNENQIIFIDTPGLHSSEKTLNKLMINEAKKSIADCDLILFLATVTDNIENYENFLSLNPKAPHAIVLSKVDTVSNENVLKKLSEYSKFSDKFECILPFSTKHSTYKITLLDAISKILPEHEYFYDPDFITTTNEKEIFKDFILESLYENLSDEVPYSSDVIIKKVKEKLDITEIYATIILDRQAHKPLVIGKSGETIKRIGIVARKSISNLIQKKVFLKLEVVIKKGWSKDEKFIKKLNNYEE